VSSHLNTYVGPFVKTGRGNDRGARWQQFYDLHDDNLSDCTIGYSSDSPLCWLPNKELCPGAVYTGNSSNVWQLTPEIIAAQLTWFRETYTAEIATLARLWP